MPTLATVSNALSKALALWLDGKEPEIYLNMHSPTKTGTRKLFRVSAASGLDIQACT